MTITAIDSVPMPDDFELDQWAPEELRERAASLAAALEQQLVALEPLCDLADEILFLMNHAHDRAYDRFYPAALSPAQVDEVPELTGARRIFNLLWQIHDMTNHDAMARSWPDRPTPYV